MLYEVITLQAVAGEHQVQVAIRIQIPQGDPVGACGRAIGPNRIRGEPIVVGVVSDQHVACVRTVEPGDGDASYNFV